MTFRHYKVQQRKTYFDLLPFLFYKYQRLFFGSLIWRGRKIWAYNFLLNLKHKLKLKENMEFHIIFIFSLLKITPHIILSYLKIGGVKQGVPLAISWKKKMTYAIKWIRMSLRNKYKRIKLKDMIEELSLALYDKGLGCRKRKKTYLEGYSNRFLLKRFKYKG